MSNLLYKVAFILIIGWLVGFLGFQAGPLIHLLLVFAVIAVILSIIQRRKIIE